MKRVKWMFNIKADALEETKKEGYEGLDLAKFCRDYNVLEIRVGMRQNEYLLWNEGAELVFADQRVNFFVDGELFSVSAMNVDSDLVIIKDKNGQLSINLSKGFPVLYAKMILEEIKRLEAEDV